MALGDVEALLVHQLGQVDVCFLQQGMTGTREHLRAHAHAEAQQGKSGSLWFVPDRHVLVRLANGSIYKSDTNDKVCPLLLHRRE